MKKARTLLLAAAAAVILAGGTASAQNFVDRFDNGNDNGWARYNPFNGRYSFPDGGYRMFVEPTPDPNTQGIIGSVAPSRATVHESFTISVDVVNQEPRHGQISMMAFRGDMEFNGYGIFLHVRPSGEGQTAQIVFNRFEAGLGSFLSNAAPVAVPPGARYRMTVTGSGGHFVGTLYLLDDLSAPLSEVEAFDGTYTSGLCSLWAGNLALGPDVVRDITFDNFMAVGCRADFNADGQADFFDYLDFVQAFAEEDESADFNFDGQVDFFDYLDFVAAFAEGCE